MVMLIREDPMAQFADILNRGKWAIRTVVSALPFIAAGFAALYYFSRSFGGKKLLIEATWAFAACFAFTAAFTFIKSAMPFFVPFYADTFFADLDKVMHGGVDPWIYTHRYADILTVEVTKTFYFAIWSMPALFFPFLLALFDRDPVRKRTYLQLFSFTWIGLGNVAAYATASVGPLYYDRLLGTDRFAGLIQSMQNIGFQDSLIGTIQQGLWDNYVDGAQTVGSGISAFPSVHVAVATMLMLYLFDRSKYLVPIGAAYLAIIMVLSVHLGWHYAVDGYFSVAAVTLAWAALWRWNARPASRQIAANRPATS